MNKRYKIKPEYVKFAINLVKSNSSVNDWLSDKITFNSDDSWYKIFKDARVLDLWFNEIPNETFNPGDYIVIKDTICRLDMVLDDSFLIETNEYSDKTILYRKVNLNDVNVRKALPSEILSYLIVKLEKETGITLGCTVLAPSEIKEKCAFNEKIQNWEYALAKENRKVLYFKLHSDNKTLLLHLSGTAYYIFYDAFKMKVIDNSQLSLNNIMRWAFILCTPTPTEDCLYGL